MVTKEVTIHRYQPLSPENTAELTTAIRDGTRSVKEVMRAQAILLISSKPDLSQILQLTGFRRRQAFGLRARFLSEGIVALTDKRAPRPKEILTKAQRLELAIFVSENVPEGGWTTGLLARHIKETYRAAYKSKTSFYLIFKEVKFTWRNTSPTGALSSFR